MRSFFFFSSRRRHTRCGRDWSSDVCSSDLAHWAQEKDSTGVSRSRIRQILAHGSARALTHIVNQDSTAQGPSINYSRGRSITIALKQARIDRVVVGGRADGVHLEPRPPAPVDTTKKPGAVR